MIPALIYQTWKSKTSLPENFAHWRASFARLNPGYTLLLWDDADNRQFIADHFAWFLPTYDGFPQEIFRVDAVRYFFLYLHGGIYVDLDTQCLKPLDPLRSQADVVLGWLGNDPTSDQAIPNAIMLSRPRQEFWLLAIAGSLFWLFGARIAYRMGFALASGDLLTGALKSTFCVARPWLRDPSIWPVPEAQYGAFGYSFPSGHAANTAG